MGDKAPLVMTLVAQHLMEWFNPGAGKAVPLGGKVEQLHVLAGSEVTPPPWMGLAEDTEDDAVPSCEDCAAYLWLRMSGRWRSERFPSGRYAEATRLTGESRRSMALEVGIARCHPLDPDPAEETRIARVQWDDGYRMDQALCAALSEAEAKQIARYTAIGAGEPYGPDGLVLVWTQTAQAQF